MTPPARTCLGCRRRAPKAELVRLAWDPADERVVVDARQVLPGRGAYLHAACASQAVRRRVIGHALRRAVDPAQVATVLGTLAGAEPAVPLRPSRLSQ